MIEQLDLFEQRAPAPPSSATCGSCANLGAAIESGVRYCHAMMMWRWAAETPACGQHAARQ